MKIIGIIPARMESSRLPGKPLINIGNKSMIRRVYESAIKANQINELYVATPNKEIFDHVNEFGKVIMTSENPLNGTERVYEAYEVVGTGQIHPIEDFIARAINIDDKKRLHLLINSSNQHQTIDF